MASFQTLNHLTVRLPDFAGAKLPDKSLNVLLLVDHLTVEPGGETFPVNVVTAVFLLLLEGWYLHKKKAQNKNKLEKVVKIV